MKEGNGQKLKSLIGENELSHLHRKQLVLDAIMHWTDYVGISLSRPILIMYKNPHERLWEQTVEI